MLKIARYGQVNSYDIAKIVAVITMITDHVRYFFLPDNTWLSLIGRISFPIFLFLIGYSHKFRNKLDIYLITLIMMLSIYLIHGAKLKIINAFILPNIILSRLILYYFIRYAEKHLLEFLIINLCLYPFVAPFVMFGTLGCLFAMIGYYVANHSKNFEFNIFIIFTVIHYIYTEHWVYNLTQTFIFIIVMIFFIYFAYNFKLKEFFIKNLNLKIMCLIISRYSIYIYIIHYILFDIVSSKAHSRLLTHLG